MLLILVSGCIPPPPGMYPGLYPGIIGHGVRTRTTSRRRYTPKPRPRYRPRPRPRYR